MEIDRIFLDLKVFVAKELTCVNIDLDPDEVSVRLIKVDGEGMIGDLEVEVNAYAFKERVKKKDEFCVNLTNYLTRTTGMRNVKTWLILSELGHSME